MKNKKIISIVLLVSLIVNLTCSLSFAIPNNLVPSGKTVVITSVLKYPVVGIEVNSEKSKFKLGDMILYPHNISTLIDGYRKEKCSKLKECVKVKVLRENKIEKLNVPKSQLTELYLLKEINAIGTITAINKVNNEIYGLSHPINLHGNIVDSSMILCSVLYKTKDLTQKKSVSGEVGYLNAVNSGDIVGAITEYTLYGFKGYIDDNEYDINNSLAIGKPKIGKAYMYGCSPVDNVLKLHEIEITSVGDSSCDFEVKDKDLLTIRGGLVMGCSGSPIIQDNKIVGGFSSILVKSPEKGSFVLMDSIIRAETISNKLTN